MTHQFDLMLSKYNDVLRVGVLRLDGEVVTWSTQGSSKEQLQSFLDVVLAKLRNLPAATATGLEECDLFHAVFLFAKAVSMNFGLFHTYDLLRRVFGRDCMLGGESMEYCLDLGQAHCGLRMCASVAWRKPGNVRALPHFDEASSSHFAPSIRGTLHSFRAEFHLNAKGPTKFVATLSSAPCTGGGLCSRICAARRLRRRVSVKDEQLHSLA
jgi:hypothetical protein